MTYSPSPRPTFEGPAHIPYETVTRHLWGDEASGEVADWIYVSSGKIHQLVFGLAPGAAFRHSNEFRTIFAADELLYVLSGVMVLADPESGEAHRVLPGEAAFFRRDTWHHAFNVSTEPLRVLELFAPPPSQGTSGSYARTKTYLTENKYTQDQWLGHYPMESATLRGENKIRVLRESDLLWRMEGAQQQALVGIWCSTEHLTVAQVQLLPGQHTDIEQHNGDESLYLLEGSLNVRAEDKGGMCWFELKPGDGFYVPQGAAHQYYNISGAPVKFLTSVAPCYTAHGC